MSVELVAQQIIALTDDDIAECQAECTRQIEHYNPLKHAKSGELNALGRHNQKTLNMIITLRDQLTEGGQKSVE